MRFACLLVSDAPLVALLRKVPELRHGPLAVFAGSESSAPGSQQRLLCVSKEALACGVEPGFSLRRAHSLCPEIILRERMPADEQRLGEILLELAFGCSPRAALASGLCAAEAAVIFDATGIRNLFRKEENKEERFATHALDCALKLEVPAVVSIASSRQVALLAARSQANEPGSFCILPSDQEKTLLAPLPLALLQPSTQLKRKMQRFGMHCIGDLLRWPRHSVLTRLGKEGLGLAALARGEDCDTPLPAQGKSLVEEVLELEFPLCQLEPLYFVLRGLLSKLLQRLALRGLTCDRLELSLQLEEGSNLRHWLQVAAPTLDAKVFLRSARLLLERTPPSSPVESLRLRTQGLAPSRDQLDFFRAAGPAPAALQALVAELESLCGAGRVGGARLLDDHRPDSFKLLRFPVTVLTHSTPARAYVDLSPSDLPNYLAPTPLPLQSSPVAAPPADPPVDVVADAADLSYATVCSPQASALALRVLRPPVAVEVRLQELGRPVWIRSKVPRGKLLFVAGPWRSTGMWWSEKDRFAFDYFDVQVSDGTLARLRHDRLQGCWELDALYD